MSFSRSRQKFEPQEATQLALDVCRGLDYAFQRGISHRDLKASNVLVSSLGQAKLVDFGLAGADPTASDAELEKIENPRTIDYAALERATGVRKDDSRSDIFFLGCIYYHMLSGKPPIEETRDRIARLSRNSIGFDRADSSSRLRFADRCAYGAQQSDAIGSGEALSNAGRDGGRFANRFRASQSGGEVARPRVGETQKRRTIMIVEPNPNVQETLRNHFKEEGYRVLVTS